jgi:hypothetical protein
MTAGSGRSAPHNETGESLEAHWAVAVISPDDRADLIAFAEHALQRMGTGTWRFDAPLPEHLLPLASAYDFAARERLDLEGTGSPLATRTAEVATARRRRVRDDALRVFMFNALIEMDADDDTGSLYHALQLSAIATAAGRRAEFEAWLAAHREQLFASSEAGVRWDFRLLRDTVELWVEVLAGSGPSGLGRAMEIVASIREERPASERQLLAALGEADEMRMRFYLFALYHLVEAATQVLLYRLHGSPTDAAQLAFMSLSLAREATAGDVRMRPALEWLFEAAARVIEQRTPQLELLPEHEAHSRAH